MVCVSTSAATSDSITWFGTDLRTLRICLNAAKQFDRSHTSSYSLSIVITMAIFCIVCEI